MVKKSTNFVIEMDLDSINEHSPWWARIFEMILGFIVLGSIANLFYLEIFGINGINHYSFGNEPENPGDYPENGTEEEQRNYNWSLQDWDDYQSYLTMTDELEDSSVTEVTQIFAILTVIIGVPAIVMFWTQHQKMMQIGIAFGATKIIGDVWTSYISSEIVANYMDSIPGGGDYSWIAKTSVFTSSMCGIFFIALTIVLTNLYHSKQQIPESGFHLNIEEPSTSRPIHGNDDVKY
ncbi:MAG: hypothetical protein L7S49_01620 [Candidatus Poseidoniaceae archaeon]|nr:hypothetical protein [Candidatus Poseidoniaceae archaeon]